MIVMSLACASSYCCPPPNNNRLSPFERKTSKTWSLKDMQSAWLCKSLELKADLQAWTYLDEKYQKDISQLQTVLEEQAAAHKEEMREKDEENQRALTLMQEPWIELYCTFEYHNSSVNRLRNLFL